MALIVAGERSGVGKTTITLALLAYVCRLHPNDLDHVPVVQSFKVGPDYIDPMFHRYVTGRPCRNLDPILTSEDYVKRCFTTHISSADFALIEGVMGLFDGVSGETDLGSTAHIARLLQIPVVLVLDCSRLSRSVAAIAHGFKTFDPSIQFAGLVLNRVGSDRHLTMLREALHPLGMPILGVIHRETGITLPDRHLGLVPTDELPELDELVDRLAHLGRSWFQWDSLLPFMQSSASLDSTKSDAKRSYDTVSIPPISSIDSLSSPSLPHEESASIRITAKHSPHTTIKIAVARDRAFNFYYADNLDLLVHVGAEIVEWSPLRDFTLPEGVCGLYFGGGFPEMFASALSANESMRQAVRRAIAAGIPTYAECGGLMYLCENLVDFEGTEWPMVGIVPTIVRMGKKLTLGYRRAIAQQDSPLLSTGSIVYGHEFHHSSLDNQSGHPLYELSAYRPGSPIQVEGWSRPNLHASYVHLHWGDRPEIPTRFIIQCRIWAERLSNVPTPVEN